MCVSCALLSCRCMRLAQPLCVCPPPNSWRSAIVDRVGHGVEAAYDARRRQQISGRCNGNDLMCKLAILVRQNFVRRHSGLSYSLEPPVVVVGMCGVLG